MFYSINSGSYIFIRAVLLGLLSLICTDVRVVAGEPVILSFHDANELMLAVSKIRVSQEKLSSTLHICRGLFVHLQDGAVQANEEWLARNQSVLEQSTLVSRYVMNAVKQDASAFVAEKMLLDTDVLVSKEIQQFRQAFTDKGRKEQHYLCNRLILSISSGGQDLGRQNPAETKRLMEFKP